jgi:hypothetical protein
MLKNADEIVERDPVSGSRGPSEPSQNWPKSSPVVLFKINPESAACVEFVK